MKQLYLGFFGIILCANIISINAGKDDFKNMMITFGKTKVNKPCYQVSKEALLEIQKLKKELKKNEVNSLNNESNDVLEKNDLDNKNQINNKTEDKKKLNVGEIANKVKNKVVKEINKGTEKLENLDIKKSVDDTKNKIKYTVNDFKSGLGTSIENLGKNINGKNEEESTRDNEENNANEKTNKTVENILDSEDKKALTLIELQTGLKLSDKFETLDDLKEAEEATRSEATYTSSFTRYTTSFFSILFGAATGVFLKDNISKLMNKFFPSTNRYSKEIGGATTVLFAAIFERLTANYHDKNDAKTTKIKTGLEKYESMTNPETRFIAETPKRN